jgi:hypothetical protein
MFKSEINSFVQNMDVIRGYINSVEPVLLEKCSENFKKDAEDLSVLHVKEHIFLHSASVT